jgi:hypothetical protein
MLALLRSVLHKRISAAVLASRQRSSCSVTEREDRGGVQGQLQRSQP